MPNYLFCAEHQNMNRARHTNDKLQTFDWGDIKCPSYVENVPTHFGNVATLVGTSLLQTHVNSYLEELVL
jgi:hypothetical protein